MRSPQTARCVPARQPGRKLEFSLLATAIFCVLAGIAASAFGQATAPAPPRLDAPELQIDQVGPRSTARPPPRAPEPKQETLEGFDLGDRVVPQKSLSPQAIRKIQMELARRGYDPGPRDGVLGKATRDAIGRYQADRGWTASGRVTVRLLVALHGGDRFAGAVPPTAGLEGDIVTIESSPLVLNIQDELKRHGYDVSVNGRLDARTVRAIETYQSYFGLEPNGEPSEQLLAHIRSRVIPLD